MSEIVRTALPGTAAHTLMKAIIREARGMDQSDVINATLSVMLEAFFQKHNRRAQVEPHFDETIARVKSTLMAKYDPVSGKRRSTERIILSS